MTKNKFCFLLFIWYSVFDLFETSEEFSFLANVDEWDIILWGELLLIDNLLGMVSSIDDNYYLPVKQIKQTLYNTTKSKS